MNDFMDSPVTIEISNPAHVCVPESMPLGGLGLPLSEKYSSTFSALYLKAIKEVTVPPAVSIGLNFRTPPNGGHPNILGLLCGQFVEGNTRNCNCEGPDSEHPALRSVDGEGTNIAHLLPIIDLPGTGDFWVYEEHLMQLLWHFVDSGVESAMLTPPDGFPQMPGLVLPYQLPKVSGPVTPQHIEAFTRAFPGLGRFLTSTLPWQGKGKQRQVPARTANSIARKALGIPVDLRVGGLVSEGAVNYAINSAAADVVHKCGADQTSRLWSFVNLRLPMIKKYDERVRPRRLSGAAWSCMLNAVLNDPFVWTCGEAGSLPWADEAPELRAPKGRNIWPPPGRALFLLRVSNDSNCKQTLGPWPERSPPRPPIGCGAIIRRVSMVADADARAAPPPEASSDRRQSCAAMTGTTM